MLTSNDYFFLKEVLDINTLQLKSFEIYVGVMETFLKKDLLGVQIKFAFQVE